MKRLGLRVSKVNWATTFDMVVKQVEDVENLTIETRVNGEIVQVLSCLQGYLAHKKKRPHTTLQ